MHWPSQWTLDDLLASFLAPRTLELRCDRCQHNEVKVRAWVSKLPRVLVLHIKRFFPVVQSSNMFLRKRHDRVQMQTELNVQKFVSNDVELPQTSPATFCRPPPTIAELTTPEIDGSVWGGPRILKTVKDLPPHLSPPSPQQKDMTPSPPIVVDPDSGDDVVVVSEKVLSEKKETLTPNSNFQVN